MIMPRLIHGFIPVDCAGDLMHDPAVRSRVRCINGDRIAAVTGSRLLRLPARNGVRRVLDDLRAHRRILESIMRRAPVLPARFGSRRPGRSTLIRLLREHEDELERAIASYGHLLQIDIQVTGPRIHADADPRLAAAREQIRLELEGLCLALHESAAGPGSALINLTVLVRPLDEARFDAAVARLDGEFGGWLHFACIGPLPPCNFVRVDCSRAGTGRSGHGAWTLSVDSTPQDTALPLVEAFPASAETMAA